MKTIMRAGISMALTAMLMAVAYVGTAGAELICPGAGEDGVPFRGTLQGAETDNVAFPTLYVDGRGTGNATHLGTFRVKWEATVDISMEPSPSTGTFVFIWPNGDRLFTDILGEGSGDPIAVVTECNTITGGTGRFAGATGAFAIYRVVDLSTGLTGGVFNGTIVKHRAK